MSSLLNKNKEPNNKLKSSLLDSQRIETPRPSETYAENNKKKSSTSTARLSYNVLSRANALVNMGIFNSIDHLFDKLLLQYETAELSEDELRTMELFAKAYLDKMNNK